MNRPPLASSIASRAAVLTFAAALGTALVCACAGNDVTARAAAAPHPASTAAISASTSPSVSAPSAKSACGPSDCTPCDETKQKCMGPGVCGNHPERASRQCTRDTDGQCRDTIVCAP